MSTLDKTRLRRYRFNPFPWLLLPLLGALLAATPALAASATPEVAIASEPLFDRRMRVPANVLLALSIDKNSVGAAYRGTPWGIYDAGFDYPGYFDTSKCYVYSPTPKEYFEISAALVPNTAHECNGTTFSGNFMNWASMSQIDLLRYGLTGGDRVTPETATETILQRAVLPSYMFDDSTLFPRRTITTSTAASANAPGRVTPFLASTAITLISCDNKIIIADNSASITSCAKPTRSNAGTALATDKAGEYLLRVKVCDANDGPARPDLCQKYGDNYKPVGSLQRNANKIRFGLMSYLPDTTQNLYGGVLRSPLKFLGPKMIEAPGYGDADNTNPEWDPATGVLYTNPADAADINSTTVKSGMINFINQFGRTGLYKNFYDPLSELYYEAIRYFQGKQPTDTTSVIADSLKEGYPVIRTWTDPVLASCQRNQIVVVADASTNYDFYVPGNARTNLLDVQRDADKEDSKWPALDVTQWTAKVGAMEADPFGAAGNPAKNPALAALDQKLTGYLQYAGFYISGLAYWANTKDIRFDKPTRVKTFVIDVDETGTGDVDFATRSPSKPRESQLYLAAKYGGFDDVSGAADANPYFTLTADGVTKIGGTTNQWDANRDGIPDNYFLASQPGTMVKALRKIAPGTLSFTSATMSTPAVSSVQVSPEHTFLYQPGFRAPRWTGTLKKLKISAADASSPLQIAPAAEWDAGTFLTGGGGLAPTPLPDDRNIYAAKRQDDGSLLTIPFKWDNLSVAQQAMLNTSPVDAATDKFGQKRLNFLRGVRIDELGQPGGVLRFRQSVLGDIVNSNVVLVGAPSFDIQGPTYAAFYELNKNRRPTLYVGANDGMLHAFDASLGGERFAFIPTALLPQLNQLASPDYVHRPYVDGQIAVAEARVGGAWKTVLAAGFGGGAQGVFVLDVTNPLSFAPAANLSAAATDTGKPATPGPGSGAIFEFSDSDDRDMGNVMGAPSIAKFRTGVTKGVNDYKYFIVVPSGLNNYRPDGSSADGKSLKSNPAAPNVLFLLSLDKPAASPWKLGDNYYKIVLPNPSPTLQSGLSPPALVIGPDGAVRFGYAGDLQGNLWRMDFTGLPPWSNAMGVSATSSTPLFTAVDSRNPQKITVQPITTRPTVVFAPGGGYVVLFGTGKYLEAADQAGASFTGQSFYAIHDTTRDEDKGVSQAKLQPRTLKIDTASNTYTITGTEFNYDVDAASKRGWYIDFADVANTGERQVTNGLVVDGQLYFNTMILGADICTGGLGRAYSMNALSGLSGAGKTGFASSVGMLGTPVLYQMGNLTSGTRDALGGRRATKSLRVLHVGTGQGLTGAPASVAAPPSPANSLQVPAGRFSWREILNWQEMRAEALKPPAATP